MSITALDISKVALEKVKKNIDPRIISNFNLIVDDIEDSQIIENIPNVDLWLIELLYIFCDEVRLLEYSKYTYIQSS